MELELTLRWLHVIGACVLLGTGAGIAFFMMMAHRTGDAALIAGTARIVVIADLVFTLTAVLAQPLTGWGLAWAVGWDLTEGWIMASLALYFIAGICWLPVVRIQIRLRDLAAEAARRSTPLPPSYHQLYRTWFTLGLPAFAAVLATLWLMLARPEF
jgi:uncharacterized membrane protein